MDDERLATEYMECMLEAHIESRRKYEILASQAENMTYHDIQSQFQRKIKFTIHEILNGARQNSRFNLFQTGDPSVKKILKNMPMFFPFTPLQATWFSDLVSAEYDEIIDSYSNGQFGLDDCALINYVLIPELATRLFAFITNITYEYATFIMLHKVTAFARDELDKILEDRYGAEPE